MPLPETVAPLVAPSLRRYRLSLRERGTGPLRTKQRVAQGAEPPASRKCRKAEVQELRSGEKRWVSSLYLEKDGVELHPQLLDPERPQGSIAEAVPLPGGSGLTLEPMSTQLRDGLRGGALASPNDPLRPELSTRSDAARRSLPGKEARVPRGPEPLRVADGVPAQAGDHRVGVGGVGVDRDPAARARLAVALQRAGGERGVEQAGAVEGEADGAGAVVAVGVPGAVAAAPDVGGGGDRVGGRDRGLDRRRRALRGGGEVAGEDRVGPGGLEAGAERGDAPVDVAGLALAFDLRRPPAAPPRRTTRPGCG